MISQYPSQQYLPVHSALAPIQPSQRALRESRRSGGDFLTGWWAVFTARRWWWGLSLLLLPLASLRAQPGGGGGLVIPRVYGRNQAGQLVPLAPAAVRVWRFQLEEADAVLAGRFAGPARPRVRWPHLATTQDLVATTEQRRDSPSREPNSPFDLIQGATPQRLFLQYRTDTMVLDVANMLPENGAGVRSQLDSLVIMPGYFSLSLGGAFRPDAGRLAVVPTRWQGLSLTPSQVGPLQATGELVALRADASLRWTLPDSASRWILRQAYALVSQHQPHQALATLAHAAAAGVAVHTPAACLLRATSYQQLGQPVEAEHWLTQAIGLTSARPAIPWRGPGDWPVRYQAYTQRQALRLRDHRYQLALADYDSLAVMRLLSAAADPTRNLTAVKRQEQVQRLVFRQDSLHEPRLAREVVAELQPTLGPALDQQWQCGHGELEVEAVQLLAQAEYHVGDRPLAFRHWYQLLLASRDSAAHFLGFFKPLVKQHPTQAELRLCLALAHVAYARTLNGGAVIGYIKTEIGELDSIEQQLPRRFEVNFFRSLWLLEVGQPRLALAQLTIAITKEPTLPLLYLHRYLLRLQLDHKLTIANDPDYAQYHAHCGEW
jgi:hypothetical protein